MTDSQYLLARIKGCPDARACIHGSASYPAIRGTVCFYQTEHGVLVAAEIRGLPTEREHCSAPFFGFHIHSGTSCSGSPAMPFENAGGHYNPCGCSHPHHAGDLPPLPGSHGCAFLVFLTDRFRLCKVLGRTVIIHRNPDDFTSQPSGNAGEMIACGRICRC